ncbi:serine hydrolase domain-containing protein [Mucilaginibacter sp. PAMB04274]|uniref:serine hydrolase domain-containing protein n=1 Tax=Mucilaginibacter sp. PAMB04274 TaxID=3138568 RepID=UPI0031F5FA71
MIFKTKIKYLLIFLTSITAMKGVAQSKVEEELQGIMKRYEAIGMSVAVVKEGKIFYTKSFGFKDVEHNTPLSDTDIFRIASISKSFTSTSLMQQVEAGKVSLDDDFGDLIGFKIRNPKYPDTKITLRMVLSHTSSINDSEGYFNLDAINPDKSPNWSKCYNSYEPGKGYQYCNLNFNMAGAVLERLTGERFDKYVKSHVLNPLKLNAGYCVDSLDNARFVTLYEYNGATHKYTPAPLAYAPRREEIANYKLGYTTPVFSPTGGMKLSATDLAKYMTMHMYDGKYNGVKIISKRSAKTIRKPVAEKQGYGLAIHTSDVIPGKNMFGHTGSAYGLYSVMFFDPKEKFGIVAITNGCNAPDGEDMHPMLKLVVQSLYSNLIKQ